MKTVKRSPPNETVGDAPRLFWQSAPVGPGQTCLLAGHALAPCQVMITRLADGPPGDPPGVETAMPEDAPENVTRIEPILAHGATLLVRLPETRLPGIFALQVANAGGTARTLLNVPDPWWVQGDAGWTATVGGWVRVHGRCLGMADGARLTLRSCDSGETRTLECRERSCWGLVAELPSDLPAGRYEVWVHNGWGGAAGWRCAGHIEIHPPAPARAPVLDVTAFGVVPNSGKDCTPGIVRALERLQALGGGVLHFPRGRYRVDGNLRSGLWIPHSLRIPPNVTIRGESMELTSLYWPDREEPLPTLIEGDSDFTVEELTIYCQGRHRNVISGRSNVVVHRVRIRANAYLHLDTPGRPGRGGRNVTEPHINMGVAIELEGDNARITDCDILHSAVAIRLKNVRGAYIARNRIRHGQCYLMSYGGERVVFERNDCAGAHLCATGASVALFFGATSCRHHYLAHNRIGHLYGGDRETVTLDGHGTAYAGGVAEVKGCRIRLNGTPEFGHRGRDAVTDPHELTLYVLAGRGAGQYRRVARCEGQTVEIDRPLDVVPDDSSIVGIGAFNGRHLFISNEVEDSGALVQLYPPNIECVVAENIGRRVYPVNVWGKFGLNMKTGQRRVEPSWFNQVIGNRIEEGNAWGNTEGGVLVYGEQVRYRVNERNEDEEEPLSRADLAAMVGRPPDQTDALAITRWTVVRGTVIANNATVRVKGAVSDVLIENVSVANSDRAIVVERGPEGAADDRGFGQPTHVVVGKLECRHVREPLSSSGAEVVVVDEGRTT